MLIYSHYVKLHPVDNLDTICHVASSKNTADSIKLNAASLEVLNRQK